MTAALSGVRRATTGARRWRRGWLIGVLVAALAVAAIGGGALAWSHMRATIPADLDLATTRASAQGHYRVTIAPHAATIPLHTIHAWTLHIEDAAGRPVEGATIAVDGGMPQHGHGLPTRPRVTGDLGHGDYLVEGLKFQMGGWWVVDFDIAGAGRRDDVRFNLILE